MLSNENMARIDFIEMMGACGKNMGQRAIKIWVREQLFLILETIAL